MLPVPARLSYRFSLAVVEEQHSLRRLLARRASGSVEVAGSTLMKSRPTMPGKPRLQKALRSEVFPVCPSTDPLIYGTDAPIEL